MDSHEFHPKGWRADSWSGSGGAENAPLLAKQIDTFSTVELLFNISKLA